MKCKLCGVEKLSKEFYSRLISNECKHPPTHCITCIIEQLSGQNYCPYIGCGARVSDAKSIVTSCETKLQHLYPWDEVEQQNDPTDGKIIKVVTLTGDFEMFSYEPSMAVEALKVKLEERFTVSPANQQLMYDDCILQSTNHGRLALLSDYKVQPFATIHLLVLMYAIPQNFNHVVFDLSWTFPDKGCDALDASCFIYSGKYCHGIVDFSQTDFGGKSVWHSGDEIDVIKKTGRHTIEAKMKEIPSSVSHLFFTLSAFKSETLADFKNPCLTFFEASNKHSDLCATTFDHALECPAVILCYVERVDKQWKIFQCGQTSAGNAKNYEPLKENIQKLIKSGDVPVGTSPKVGSASEIDLAFAMDCTGSMGSYIHQAQQNIKAIVDEIGRQKVSLRLALIEYRDHPPQDKSFVTRVLNFTDSLSIMKSRLDACAANGGGDGPEAVADALNGLLSLTWRQTATKICVFISDAPPHGLSTGGDGFPTGCPLGHDPMVIARRIAQRGIVLYMVGCEPSIVPYKDWFMAVAHITGGQYVPLASAQMLTSVIVGGAMEELSLCTLLENVTVEVQTLAYQRDGSVNQKDFEEKVFQKVKGFRTKKLTIGASELPKPTTFALQLAAKNSLADVRSIFVLGSCSSAVPSTTSASFSAIEGDVTRSQVSRMVQRVLMTSGLKSKCIATAH